MTEVEGSERADTAFRLGQYVFRRAHTREEIEQLHELNYRTFVEEIQQHEDPGGHFLIDKFHDKNIYFMALDADQVVGMVAVHGEPPFSIEEKLSDPSVLQNLGDRPLEVRLLAVEPSLRKGQIFAGLGYLVYDYARSNGYTHLLISGIKDQLNLYYHLGFQPIGPGVVNGGAHFIPMAVSIDDFPAGILRDAERFRRRAHGGTNGNLRPRTRIPSRLVRQPRPGPVLLLPGPVQMTEAVRRALDRPPIYHRGAIFNGMFRRIRATLAALVNKPVALFNGSGTLANEVIAANLKADTTLKKGAVLVTGEFGRRLAGQATRHGLDFRTLERPWGSPWPLDDLAAHLDEDPDIDWVWGTHLETSTGRLNDLDGLLAVTEPRGIKVCLDCVSGLGAVPLDLARIHMASGASGKSLASKAGVSLVFACLDDLGGVDSERVPVYLDLRATLETPGPRFTFGSQDLVALDSALRSYATAELREHRFRMYRELGRHVRRRLAGLGVPTLVPEESAAPIIATIEPPRGQSVTEFVEMCRGWGYLVGGESGYLQSRGWAQIANMGDLTREDCEGFFNCLERWLEETA